MTGIRKSDDLVHFIATYCNSSKFWDELYDLQDDIDFFSAYVRRNKKSNFDFSLKFYNSYRANFLNSLWNHYGWITDKDTIEWIYGLYVVTKVIINNLVSTYNETEDFIHTTIPREWIYKMMALIYNCTGLYISDYISDFVSQFSTRDKMKEYLNELYYEYDNKTSGGNEK